MLPFSTSKARVLCRQFASAQPPPTTPCEATKPRTSGIELLMQLLAYPSCQRSRPDRFRSDPDDPFRSSIWAKLLYSFSEQSLDPILFEFRSQVLIRSRVASLGKENVSGVPFPCQPSSRFFFFATSTRDITPCFGCSRPGCGPSHQCGEEGNRTPDLLLAKQALYQLSYFPARVPPTMCACLDLNQGPRRYQRRARTN